MRQQLCFKFAKNFSCRYNKRKKKELVDTKTISIRLEDTVYEELSEMLNAMGQTKQAFFKISKCSAFLSVSFRPLSFAS